MKKLLLLVGAILFYFSSFCQQPAKPVTFTSIETVDSNIKKETLYFNTIEWVGKHFANASKVLQIADKEAGLILVKGSFNYQAPGYLLSGSETRSISFMLKISFKDGRYKIEMSDFKDDVLGLITYDEYDETSSTKKNFQKQWKAAQMETQSNIVSVQKSIKDFIEQNINW
jgi:hypothetical protein